jgi:hypothetical protein
MRLFWKDLGGTSLSAAKGVAFPKTTPFAKPQGVPPNFTDFRETHTLVLPSHFLKGANHDE